MNKRNVNVWMALCLFGSLFLTIANIHEPLHYFFGILFFGLCAVHIALHWKWFSAYINRKPGAQTKLVNQKTNILLGFFFTICAFTGITSLLHKVDILSWSRHRGFHLHAFHELSAFAAIITLAVHTVMHRKWLAAVIRRSLGQSSRPGSAGLEN